MNPETPLAQWLESAWLARYLDRQLSDEETAWFEAYVLDKPNLLHSIEMDTELRDALAASTELLKTPQALTPVLSPVGALPGRMNRRFAMAAAAAASMLLGLAVGRWSQKPLLPSELIAVPPGSRIDDLRSVGKADDPHKVESKSPYVQVELFVPSNAEALTLYFGDRPAVALEKSSENFVSFLVDRSLLANTDHAEVRYRLNGQNVVRVVPLQTIR